MDRGLLVEDVMRKDFVAVDTDKPVKYVAKLMEKADADGFLLIEDDKLVGLATYWDLMVRLGDMRVREAEASGLYASSVMEPVKRVLSPKSRVIEAAKIMVEDPFHMIPVLEGGEVVGVVEARDLAKALLDEELPASSLSLKGVPTVNTSDRVIHARKLMMTFGLRGLAVLNEDLVVGVVCDDQIARAYLDLVLTLPMERQKAIVKNLVLVDIRPRHVKALYEATFSDVAKLISEEAVKGVPLVDQDGALVGFVTVKELATFISAQA